MKVALIGYGVENAGAYRYLSKKNPEAEFTIYDEKTVQPTDMPENVAFVGGADLSSVEADLLVRTPGVSKYKLPENASVTSATEIFLEECTVPVIGVTGSKGKGTTASLIASILKAGGKKAWLVGNIGTPALDILKNIQDGDIVVYEMSSFQLWDVTKSPQTAVVMMIEPEHLDVHRDLNDYIEAKANIARFQSDKDLIIYNNENEFSRHVADESSARHIGYPSHDAAHVRSNMFCYGETVICPVEVLRLPGQHNIGNALAAIDAAWPFVDDPVAIGHGLTAFSGLPHRLKFVRTVDGINFYDDSIATTPGSAIAAIRAFDGPKTLILGGSSKGVSFEGLAREVKNASVTHAVLIGDEASRIKSALDSAGFTDYTVAGNESMDNIVTMALGKSAEGGATVILSPACASFGMFKSYADRGDQFIAAVNKLAEEDDQEGEPWGL